MQKTKQDTTHTQESEAEVPTEVNETSAQVSQDADELLAEVDELLTESFDPELAVAEITQRSAKEIFDAYVEEHASYDVAASEESQADFSGLSSGACVC